MTSRARGGNQNRKGMKGRRKGETSRYGRRGRYERAGWGKGKTVIGHGGTCHNDKPVFFGSMLLG